MHVALVTPEFVSEESFDGGLANYIYKLAKWLVSNKHRVTIFLLANTSGSFNYEDLLVEKIKIIDYAWRLNYQAKRFKLNYLFTEQMQCFVAFRQNAYFVKKALKKFNKNNHIDIVQYPHIMGYSFYKPKNIPVIVRISSSTKLCNDMGGWGRSNSYMKALEKFEFKAMKSADGVFGPSKMIASLAEPIINKKIKIIETPYMKPQNELNDELYIQTLNNKKYVLFFGSIGLIKGVGTIAEIIYDLLKQNPTLYYVFVGKHLHNKINTIDVWDYLLNKAAEYKNRIIYLPSLKHELLFPIIKHAELITLPSRTDNFPNTCIESMANSKIVIGTKGNGFEQLINDGENGFLIDVDNHNELLTKINDVLQMSVDAKKKIEVKALEKISNLHPNIVLTELLNYYKEFTLKKI